MPTKFYDPLLLVAEDSDEDFAVLQRLMKQMAVQNPIHRCTDGDEVLDFLYQSGDEIGQESTPKPSIILLDLNLPGTDGREVLEQLKQDGDFREIPVVIFTTSSNPKDVEFCYQNGANGYLVKPVNSIELQRTVQAFVDYWLEVNTLPSLG
ncbi:MAG: response regulator [Leptolyngbyaceae cyanobacterium MO_188.B28]|nr:response regulator [Leptolyngbyaceae cyanobacterium MO_188.B28]